MNFTNKHLGSNRNRGIYHKTAVKNAFWPSLLEMPKLYFFEGDHLVSLVKRAGIFQKKRFQKKGVREFQSSS